MQTNQSEVSIVIRGTGGYVPHTCLTNEELSEKINTSNEWIQSRTGIRERRIAQSGEEASDMALEAARRALSQARLQPTDIDLLIVATLTPDMPLPSTSCIVQRKLGLCQIPCFDLHAACSGFIYGLEVVQHMMRSEKYKNVLLIGVEKLSSVVDWEDRRTCVLFGDAAGACVLSRSDQLQVGLIGNLLGSDGNNSSLLHIPAGGTRLPITPQRLKNREHLLKMNGREVFKIAVRLLEQASLDLLKRCNVSIAQLSCIIPHQANIRIIEALSTRLKVPMEKFFINIDRYGNTSAASIPLALEEALTEGRIQSGDYILMVAFGAGLTWGASLVKWHS